MRKMAFRTIVLLVEKDADKHNQSVSFSGNQSEKVLVDKTWFSASSVASGVHRDLLKKLLLTNDTEMKEVWVLISAKLYYVEFLKRQMLQRKIVFEMTKEVLETRLKEAEAGPDASLMEMTARRNSSHHEMDRLSSDRNAVQVYFKNTRCQSSAIRNKIRTVSGQFIEQTIS